MSNPSDLITALELPEKAGSKTIYHSNELTIVNVTWAPWMTAFLSQTPRKIAYHK